MQVVALRYVTYLLLTFVTAVAFAKPPLTFSAKNGHSVKVESYDYLFLSGPPESLSLEWTQKDAASVKELMKKNLGNQVEVRIGKRVLISPTVKAVPDGRKMQISFENAASAQEVKKLFEGEK